MTDIAKTIAAAISCHKAGQLQQAEKLYRNILQQQPDNPVVLHSLGLIAYQRQNYKQAADFIKKAVKQTPLSAQLHNSMGIVLEALGKFTQAIEAYRQAISLKPNFAEAYHNTAIALQSMEKYDEAIEQCKKAVELSNNFAQAYHTMGFSLEKQQRFAEAVESYKQAVRIDPQYTEAYNHLGAVLNDRDRFEEAIENLTMALQLDPGYAEAHNNLGIAFNALGRFDEAADSYQKAVQSEPSFAEAYYNRANSLRSQGKCTQAVDCYDKAIGINPDYAHAHWNKAHTLLLDGKLSQGWKQYQWRKNPQLDIETYQHEYYKPCWDGSSFTGKRLLVHYEQGFGDNIQFVRYLPMVKELGGTVIYEVRKPLLKLFQQSVQGVDQWIEASDDKPNVEFDYHISLLDLPGLFDTTLQTIPRRSPYLFADSKEQAHWHKKISGDGFKVGIVWAGKATHGNNRNRSCKLDFFMPLFEINGVKIYSLQKDRTSSQAMGLESVLNMTDLASQFDDFSDTAAAIANLDLVISVDTAVLHLAGAMGKRTWALIPFEPEWRWMLNRDDSPWYPTIKIFRQKQLGDWHTVFECITKELKALIDSN